MKQIYVTRTVIGPGVVAEAVVDHPCGTGLAHPHDWVRSTVGGVFAQNRDVGIGAEVAVTSSKTVKSVRPRTIG
jgi:hypothetical protein